MGRSEVSFLGSSEHFSQREMEQESHFSDQLSFDKVWDGWNGRLSCLST